MNRSSFNLLSIEHVDGDKFLNAKSGIKVLEFQPLSMSEFSRLKFTAALLKTLRQNAIFSYFRNKKFRSLLKESV